MCQAGLPGPRLQGMQTRPHSWLAGRQSRVACSLQGSIEDKYQTLQAQRTEAALDSIPEADADGKPLTKKARAALVKAAEQVRRSQASEPCSEFGLPDSKQVAQTGCFC